MTQERENELLNEIERLKDRIENLENGLKWSRNEAVYMYPVRELSTYSNTYKTTR